MLSFKKDDGLKRKEKYLNQNLTENSRNGKKMLKEQRKHSRYKISRNVNLLIIKT
jgi:hypothetical protein